MTRMENLQPSLDEQTRQDAVYEAAMRSISASKRERERKGYVVMGGAMEFGEGALGDGLFGKISHGAKLFMIAFACALPPLLVWQVLL
ncbi:hypothetical protein [uncultured Tateyamaria sp.]|uniref:hypothetical protein n=1 Tax=uncultured Tateyamaria sp. TaxID=455651 RepID=UPI0026274E5B|nr:hypothetical protein [uncultured Tateyamaria sp.]